MNNDKDTANQLVKDILPEMNFCRRCGAALKQDHDHVFMCENGHTIFANASPAVALLLFNDNDELVVLKRAIEPGKGLLDFPGGFCDGNEPLLDAIYREIEEEIGVPKEDYSVPKFLHSAIDGYNYKGETLPVISVSFTAVCTKQVALKAADDAESAEFVPITELDVQDMYFPSLQTALLKAKAEKVH